MRRKELCYDVTSGSNVMHNVHWCVTVFYQQIENSNIANQIHRFAIDYGKFVLAHEEKPKLGYWPVALEGEGSNCFSIAQLVEQKKQ